VTQPTSQSLRSTAFYSNGNRVLVATNCAYARTPCNHLRTPGEPRRDDRRPCFVRRAAARRSPSDVPPSGPNVSFWRSQKKVRCRDHWRSLAPRQVCRLCPRRISDYTSPLLQMHLSACLRSIFRSISEREEDKRMIG